MYKTPKVVEVQLSQPTSKSCCSKPISNQQFVQPTINASIIDKILQCFCSLSLGFKKKPPPDLQFKAKGLKKVGTESDIFLYELANSSEILTGQDTINLGKHFQPRAIGFPWKKLFSTTEHGFSLNTLYRTMGSSDLPVLLLIEDMKGHVFGAMLSCSLRISEKFYGDSSTFLFRCRPTFEAWKWSGNNFYFIQGKEDFISIGSSDGKYGIWVDDSLDKGRTDQCSTFASPPLVQEKDFQIKVLECWTIGTL